MTKLGTGPIEKLFPELADAALRGDVIELSLGARPGPGDYDEILNVIPVLFDAARPTAALDELPGEHPYILLRGVLQHVRDYRALLRATYDNLAIGGLMVVTVPHQFLAERKFRPPSRYGRPAERWYTPASLLIELEEALPPAGFRIRALSDDDAMFDYDCPIQDLPAGHDRIVLAVEKIEFPGWAGEMKRGDDPRAAPELGQSPPIQLAKAKTFSLSSVRPEVARICALKLDHRGDFVLAGDAFQALRESFPEARITLICGSWNVSAARELGYFDEILSFDFFPEDASAKTNAPYADLADSFGRLVEGRFFDIAIDLRFFPDSRPLLKIVQASYRAGFDRWNRFPWLDISLDLQSPSIDGRASQGFFDVRHFHGRGRRSPISINFERLDSFLRPGHVVWGPYADFDAGEYQFEFAITPRGAARNLVFDICSDGGRQILGVGEIRFEGGRYQPFVQNFAIPSKAVEFRIHSRGLSFSRWSFFGLHWWKKGQLLGIHQGEAMFLLVQLVAKRMELPFLQEVTEG